MKRTLTVVLILIIMITLFGCKSKTQENISLTPENSNQTQYANLKKDFNLTQEVNLLKQPSSFSEVYKNNLSQNVEIEHTYLDLFSANLDFNGRIIQAGLNCQTVEKDNLQNYLQMFTRIDTNENGKQSFSADFSKDSRQGTANVDFNIEKLFNDLDKIDFEKIINDTKNRMPESYLIKYNETTDNFRHYDNATTILINDDGYTKVDKNTTPFKQMRVYSLNAFGYHTSEDENDSNKRNNPKDNSLTLFIYVK